MMLINNDTIIKDSDPIMRKKSEKVNVPLTSEDHGLIMTMLQYVRDSIDPQKAEENNLRPAACQCWTNMRGTYFVTLASASKHMMSY